MSTPGPEQTGKTWFCGGCGAPYGTWDASDTCEQAHLRERQRALEERNAEALRKAAEEAKKKQ